MKPIRVVGMLRPIGNKGIPYKIDVTIEEQKESSQPEKTAAMTDEDRARVDAWVAANAASADMERGLRRLVRLGRALRGRSD